MITNIHERATWGDCFEFMGSWWLAENPATQVPGIIRYEPGGGLSLTLLGQIERHAPDVVLGLCQGVPCTLLQVQYEGHTEEMGQFGRLRLSGEQLVIGAHFQATQAAVFSRWDINFPELGGWHGGYPLHEPFRKAPGTERGDELEFAFKRPPLLEVRMEPLTAAIRIRHELLYGVGRNFYCEHRAYLDVIPDKKQDIGWFLKAMWSLQELMSLLIGHAIHPIEILASHTDREEKLKLIRVYVSSLYPPNAGGESALGLHFRDISDKFGEVVREWFEIVDTHRSIYGPLLGVMFSPESYAETQFLALVQGLEAFHRQGFPGLYVPCGEYDGFYRELVAGLPPRIPSALRSALVDRLKYGNEYSLRRRLTQLLGTLPDSIGEMFHKNPSEFISSVVDLRNRLVHVPVDDKLTIFDAETLLVLTLKVRALLTILLMRRVRVPDEAILRAAKLAPFGI